MRVVVIGTDLPGRTFCEPDGTPLNDVHVGVQLGTNPEHLMRGDASETRWELDVRLMVSDDGILDFRGPAVQGIRRLWRTPLRPPRPSRNQLDRPELTPRSTEGLPR